MFGRRALIALPAIAICLAACGPTPDQVNNSGHEPYASADYEAALDAYVGARDRVPELGEPHYNAGNALYRMEEIEESLGEYDEALKFARGDLRARSSTESTRPSRRRSMPRLSRRTRRCCP